MNLQKSQFRFPFVDLAIVAAMVLIGWATWRLAKADPQIASDRQEAQELREAFKRGRKMAGAGIKVPEGARRESYVIWQEARALQKEYRSVADRLAGELPDLERALGEAPAPKGGEELAQRMQELRAWIEKQKNRATFDPLEVTSKELETRLIHLRQSGTNGPLAIDRGLGSLMGEIAETYERYLSNYNSVAKAARPVTRKTAELPGTKPVASEREEATTELARLNRLAEEARQAEKNIESLLKIEESANAANPTTGEQQVLEEALLRADSPTEFAQGLWREPGKGEPAPATATVGLTPEHQLHQVQYVLLVALGALGVLLILDVYFRMVIQQGLISQHRKGLSRLEDQHRQELRQLEQMAAQLAHEIRNRLTTINAWMFTFQRKLSEATPEHKETRVIRGEVKRINEILGEFIQLARPEVPRMARMSAEPLLKEIGELMPPQLHAPGLRLECHAEGKAEFQGDRRQLKEVLENLVQNAAQSMSDEGKGAAGGEIILRARDGTLPLKGTETKVVIIEVEDNGPGIRPELKGRLFEPFFSTKEQGTGLGLPICARIIDGHGGILDFDTQVGRGTVFRIVLPAYEDRK